MKRVLVVFTGGTIGSVEENGVIMPGKRAYQLIHHYEETHKEEMILDTIEPYNILSENLTGKYLQLLIGCVKTYLQQDYDGIIITHGTDTLQYSAAALSYMLGCDTIPILLVSANYTLEDSRSNGYDNFEAAVQFIQQTCGRGVFVAYKNTNEPVRIHRATRLMKHFEYSDYIMSLDNQYFGEMVDGLFSKNTAYKVAEEDIDLSGILEDTDINAFPEYADIVQIHAAPGIIYPEITSNAKAVLLSAYHSGTFSMQNDEFRRFLQQVKKRQIPVFLIGMENRVPYVTTKEYQEHGIIVLPKASQITTYVKLWILVGYNMNFCDLMMKSISEDVII